MPVSGLARCWRQVSERVVGELLCIGSHPFAGGHAALGKGAEEVRVDDTEYPEALAVFAGRVGGYSPGSVFDIWDLMRDTYAMRITLNLDDDFIATAKALATQQRKPVGEVVSSPLRKPLKPTGKSATVRNGITLFPVAKNAGRVTPAIIRALS